MGRVAEHALGTMGTTYAWCVRSPRSCSPRGGTASSVALDALLTLPRPVTETRFVIPGQTRALTHVVGTTTPGLAIDDNIHSLAIIGSATLNSDLDGHGLARRPGYDFPHPDGANVALITLTNHRRTPGAATTLTADVVVRSLNALTGSLQRDNLFRVGPYRHSFNHRTTVLTGWRLLVLGAGLALEVELAVLNELPAGTAAETWDRAN